MSYNSWDFQIDCYSDEEQFIYPKQALFKFMFRVSVWQVHLFSLIFYLWQMNDAWKSIRKQIALHRLYLCLTLFCFSFFSFRDDNSSHRSRMMSTYFTKFPFSTHVIRNGSKLIGIKFKSRLYVSSFVNEPHYRCCELMERSEFNSNNKTVRGENENFSSVFKYFYLWFYNC